MSKQDWDRSHRRYQLVNELAARPELLVEPVADRITEEFGTREHALRALHQRWVTLVNGCLDVEMETGSDDDTSTTLARALRRAVAHSPALAETMALLRVDPLVGALEDTFDLRLARSIGLDRPGTRVADAVREVRRITLQAVAAETTSPSERRARRPRHPFRWVRRPEPAELF